MKILNKTLSHGFTMPAIGKGIWMAGTKKKTYSYINEDVHTQGIKDAISSGITYIDTAERSAGGYGEQLVGKAIKGMERKNLFITSKLSSKHLTYDSIILAAKQTLNRTKALYLDIYFIHFYDTRVSLKETMRAMDYLIDKNIIKHIGVCNFTIQQIDEAQSYTKNKIVANQVRYNVMSREAEKNGIVAYCQKNDIMLIAWRPFNQDLFTPEQETSLQQLATKYDKSILQIATAWLLQQKNVVVLANLSSATELKETIEALTIKFDKQDSEETNHQQKSPIK